MKTEIEALKFMFKLENIMNIRRDYLLLNKRKQILVSMRIVFEVLLSSTFYVHMLVRTLELKERGILDTWTTYFTVFFVCILLLYGCSVMLYFGPRHGHTFKKALRYLNENHKNAEGLRIYNKSMTTLKRQCYLAAIAFVAIRSILVSPQSLERLLQYQGYIMKWDYTSIRIILTVLFRTWLECRFGLGVLFFYASTSVVREIQKHLTYQLESCGKRNKLDIDLLKTCAATYNDLFKCNRLLMQCLGRQVGIPL